MKDSNMKITSFSPYRARRGVHVFVGPRASGKTTAMAALLYCMKSEIDKSIVMAPLSAGQFTEILGSTETYGEGNSSVLQKLFANQKKDLQRGEALSHAVVILDDVIWERPTRYSSLMALVNNCGLLNVSILMSMQYLMDFKFVSHADHIYLFDTRSACERERIVRCFRSNFSDYSEFDQVFKENSKNHDCLVMDQSGDKHYSWKVVTQVKREEAATIIQKNFRGWHFRISQFWNPSTAIGRERLKKEAERVCPAL